MEGRGGLQRTPQHFPFNIVGSRMQWALMTNLGVMCIVMVLPDRTVGMGMPILH